jgi:PAS domain S-box-containing protein
MVDSEVERTRLSGGAIGRLTRGSLRTRLVGAFAAVLLVTILLSGVALHSATQNADASRWVSHTQEVISDIETMRTSLARVQNAYRGYLLAGTQEYLTPYFDFTRAYEARLANVRSRSRDNPEQLQRWDALEEQVDRWREDILEPGIELRSAVNRGEAELADIQGYVRTSAGLTAFNEITATLDAGVGLERSLLAERRDEAAAERNRLRLILVGGTALAVAIGAVVTWLLSRDVATSMANLTRQARRMAGGELDARIASRRSDEIGQTAAAFDDMADRLQLAMRQLEDAARQAQDRENQLRTIVDNAAEGILTILEDGTITTANPTARAMFAPDGSTLVGRCFDDLLADPPDHPKPTFADIRPEPGSERGVLREVEGCRTDGSSFPLEAVVSEIPEGAERRFIGIVRDITQRRTAEAQLRRQMRAAERAQSSTRAVLDAAGDAMILIGRDGTIVDLNQQFSDVFGVDATQVTGTPMREYGARLDRTFVDADRFRAMLYASIGDTETRITESFQQRWPVPRDLELYSIFVKTASGEELGRLYAFRDVTHQRELDRAKNEFVSLVSHELRTPLTSIKGYVDLLLDGEVGELEPDQREFLGIVGSNAERLVSLINDLLDISRIEAGRIELHLGPVELGPLLDRILTSFRPQLEDKRQQASVTIAPGLPAVEADEDRLTQVFANLISNAHKYTPAGGRIAIAARASERDVIVDITDSGIGMSEEEIEKLFTRFFRAQNRTTQEVGGTGLGLSITRSLIELHRGTIAVASAPGEGSTFTVTIPQAQRARPAPGGPMTGEPAGGTVLIVEDDADIARLIQLYLRRAGYRAVVAPDANAGLTLAREERPDLITLDVMLPDADGFTLLEWLKRDPETREIPVVMLSMLPDEGTGERLGAVDYVVKPIREQALVSRIGEVLRHRPSPTVLVADDDDDIRRLFARHLKSAGYEVVEAANGVETLAMLESRTVDLILLDVRMPEMDGIETLGALRERDATRSVPVIMITAGPDPVGDEGTALDRLGIAALLSKSISPGEVALAIDRAIASSTHPETP